MQKIFNREVAVQSLQTLSCLRCLQIVCFPFGVLISLLESNLKHCSGRKSLDSGIYGYMYVNAFHEMIRKSVQGPLKPFSFKYVR